MRAGCRSLNSISAWRSLPSPNRFCMRFYCPVEANHGTGPQKTVDNFMTINSIWSRESLIITQGCSAKVFLPESLGWAGSSELPLGIQQAHWGPVSHLPLIHLGECVERWTVAPGKAPGSPASFKPLLIRHFLGARHIQFFQVSIPVMRARYSHFPDEKS